MSTKLLTKAINTFDRILDITAVFTGILIIFLILIVSADVFLRYSIGKPLLWVQEIAAYSLVYIGFLVAAWVLRGEGHVRMDFVLVRLSPGTQNLLNAVTSIISAIVCFLLTWYGVKVSWGLYQMGYLTPEIIPLPKCIFVATIPLSCFLLVIQLLRRASSNLRGWRVSLGREQA